MYLVYKYVPESEECYTTVITQKARAPKNVAVQSKVAILGQW